MGASYVERVMPGEGLYVAGAAMNDVVMKMIFQTNGRILH